MDVKGKHILILGLAREGVSLARFLTMRGARVTVTDSATAEDLRERIGAIGAPVQMLLGGSHPEAVSGMDAVFVSPGVPQENPVYRSASAAGIPIHSMTTLFFDLVGTAGTRGTVVGVTGSSGKTTTTGLIGHILRQARRDVVVGGNIGDPMLELLPRIGADTIVVLELSSFQLDLLRRSPHISVVTNITPNHLDRHRSMEDYIAAKRHIVEHQGSDDYAVLNAADPVVRDFASRTPATIRWFGSHPAVRDGAVLRDESVGLVDGGKFRPVMSLGQIPLLGSHNVENVLAALAATSVLGITPETMAAAVTSFRPAPHRLQTVAARRGVHYVDDSIATSPARAVVALRALEAPVLLIAGGRDKHLPWEDFARLAVEKVRALFLIGEAAPLIEEAVCRQISLTPGLLQREAVRCFRSLEEAVTAASRIARPGDVVLLSPGCTSYDMFADFEERGAVFARAVEALDAA